MDQPPNVVVTFPRHRRIRTVGELVGSIDSIPNNKVRPALIQHMSTLTELIEAKRDQTEIAQEMVLVGALIHRALFKNMGVPVDPDFVIDPG